MKTIESVIVFPCITAALGGAEWVRASARIVRIKLPGRPDPVRMLRSQLPDSSKWTAFTLADAAGAILKT